MTEKLVSEGIIEIIRWKRKFDVIGKLNLESKITIRIYWLFGASIMILN